MLAESYYIQLGMVDCMHEPFVVGVEAKNGVWHVAQLPIESHVAQGYWQFTHVPLLKLYPKAQVPHTLLLTHDIQFRVLH